MNQLTIYLNGAITTCLAIIALFFFFYWKDSRDRLFLFFCSSFVLQMINRIVMEFIGMDEPRTPLYWVRFLSFVIIIIGIIDKNRAQKQAPRVKS